jgi:hypothetical protein
MMSFHTSKWMSASNWRFARTSLIIPLYASCTGFAANLAHLRARFYEDRMSGLFTMRVRHLKTRRILVLLGRIELPTSSLPRMRSTTELQQRFKSAGLCVATPEKSSNLRLDRQFGTPRA